MASWRSMGGIASLQTLTHRPTRKTTFARECSYQCDVLKPKPQAPTAPASSPVGVGVLHLEGPAVHVEVATDVNGTCREKSRRLPLGAWCLSPSPATNPEFLTLALCVWREASLCIRLQRMRRRSDMSRRFVCTAFAAGTSSTAVGFHGQSPAMGASADIHSWP